MYSIIFSQVGRQIAGYFKTRALPKLLTVLGFVGVFVFLMVGIYELLSHGLAFIAGNTFFGAAVSLYLYEMILLVVVALSIATALIEGTFSLFRNANELWIVSTPGYKRIPDMVLAETVSGGAFLPLIILALPTLAAMQHVYHIGVIGFVLGLLSILFLVAASVLGTFILVFVVAKILSSLKILRLSIVLAVVLAIVVIAGAVTWHVVGAEGATILFPDYASTNQTAQATTIVEHFKYLPSHPAALVLYGAQEGNVGSEIVETILLGILTAILYAIYRAVSVWYLPLWQSLQAEPQSEHARTATGPQKFPRYLHGPMGALFEKELLVITRTGRDFMWLLFMLFLWLLQIGIDILIKKQIIGSSIGAFPLIIQAMEVGVVAYFLGAFALRFAFPTLSTEHGTAWIVNTSPLSLSKIYIGKLIFFCSFFGMLSLVVALLHSYLLGLSLASSLGLIILSFVIGITITIFSIMFGILFPNFETTDPQALSTSLPGLAIVFLVLIYGALGSFAFLSLLAAGHIEAVSVFVLASILFSILFIYISLQKLKTFEFSAVI